jgi:hypothetical protein
MTLEYTPEGLLTPRIHHADDLAELYEPLVRDAPHRGQREIIYRGIEIFRSTMVDIAGPAPLWVGGAFAQKVADVEPPHAELVYLCEDAGQAKAALGDDRLFGLLTLTGVSIWRPVATGLQHMRGVGGTVHAYLATPRRFAYWQKMLMQTKDADGTSAYGVEHGIVEVGK